MAAVAFNHVSKVYPDGTRAVSGMDLASEDGEFIVLVGPSGCGKTTALRMVAGLEEITEGEVRIGDRVVNHVPPRDRDIAMVFQSYALYPHLTVRENMAFGLRLRKLDKAEIDAPGRRAPLRPWVWTSCSTRSRARSPAGSASGWRWAGRSCASRRRS